MNLSMTADQRCACGVTAASGAPRCRACPLGGFVSSTDAGTVRPRIAPEAPTALLTYSRWKKSAGTFGPTGRVVATCLLLIPLPVFAAAIATGFGIIGGGIYIVVVMPWALRDIWKRAAIPIQGPEQVVTPVRF
jgi:hypothetical protein